MPTLKLLNELWRWRYKSSVILTYGCDLSFYETVVWKRLYGNGCYNNMVFADADCLQEAVHRYGSDLRRIGRFYTAWPIDGDTSFHPKIILLTAPRSARLIIGSGNLNPNGYGRNLELFSDAEYDEDNAHGLPLIRQAWQYIKSLGARLPDSGQRQLASIEEEAPWLSAKTESGAFPTLVWSPHGESIIDQMRKRLPKDVRTLSLVSPFWDKDLKALTALAAAFNPRTIEVFLQPETVSLEAGQLRKIARDLQIKVYLARQIRAEGRPYLHAKMIVFHTKEQEFVYWGSGNLTHRGIGSLRSQANFEAGVLQECPKGVSVLDELGLSKCRDNPVPLDDLKSVCLSSEPRGSGSLSVLWAEIVGHNLHVEMSSDAAAQYGWTLSGMAGPPVRQKTIKGQSITFGLSSKAIETLPGVLTLQGRRKPENDAQYSILFHVHNWQELSKNAPSGAASRVRKLLSSLDGSDQSLVELIPLIEEIVLRRPRREAEGSAVTGRQASTPKEPAEVNGHGKVGYSEFVGASSASPSLSNLAHHIPDELGLLVDFLGPFMGRSRNASLEAPLDPADDDDEPQEYSLENADPEADGSDAPEAVGTNDVKTQILNDGETIDYYCRKFIRLLKRYPGQLRQRLPENGGPWDLCEIYVLVVLALRFIRLYGLKEGVLKKPELLAAFLEFVDFAPGFLLAEPAAPLCSIPVGPSPRGVELFAVALLISGYYYDHIISSYEEFYDLGEGEDSETEIRYWRGRAATMVGRSIWKSGVWQAKKQWRAVVDEALKGVGEQLVFIKDKPRVEWDRYIGAIESFLAACQKHESSAKKVSGGGLNLSVGDLVWHKKLGPCMVDRGSGRDTIRVCDFSSESPQLALKVQYAPLEKFGA